MSLLSVSGSGDGQRLMKGIGQQGDVEAASPADPLVGLLYRQRAAGNHDQQIVAKLWNNCTASRDDVEQLT